MVLTLVLLLSVLGFVAWLLHDCRRAKLEFDRIMDNEVERSKPQEPWWRAERVVHLPSIEPLGETTPVRRVPCDPIDAINPADPTAPTLREQYREQAHRYGRL